jgi:hypothetical protein
MKGQRYQLVLETKWRRTNQQEKEDGDESWGREHMGLAMECN